MAELPKEGDELKKQYIAKALSANSEAASGAKFSDLFNKDSSIYEKPAPTEEERIAAEEAKKRNAPKPVPTVDAEGFPIMDSMHTYKEDLAGIVNSDKISLERIAMMQSDEKRAAPVVQKPEDKKNNLFIIGSICLLIIAVVGIFAAFIFRKNAVAPAPTIQKEKYLIFSETSKDIDITNITKTEMEGAIKMFASNFKEQDSVLEAVLRTGSEQEAPSAGLPDLLEKTNARIPDDLARALYSKFFLGLYSKVGNTNPFLIIFTSSYDIAYPALLRWEGFMQDDMNWLFDTRPKLGASTPALAFKDRVVANTDARSFEDENGKTAFFYVFIDQNTILFARTADTVRMVQDRLRQAKFQ